MAGRERSISALRACHSRELLAGASQPRQRLLVASGHDRDAKAGMFRIGHNAAALYAMLAIPLVSVGGLGSANEILVLISFGLNRPCMPAE